MSAIADIKPAVRAQLLELLSPSAIALINECMGKTPYSWATVEDAAQVKMVLAGIMQHPDYVAALQAQTSRDQAEAHGRLIADAKTPVGNGNGESPSADADKLPGVRRPSKSK